MTVTVVVGNPKPQSRTWAAAHLVAQRLTGAPATRGIDVVDLGAGLLAAADEAVTAAVAAVLASELVVFASPTYKAGYTGLLKLFLDRFGTGSLTGVTAVPLMLGGAWNHALAPEVFLKPVLVELGASCPTAGLYLLDTEPDGPRLEAWLALAVGQVEAARRFGRSAI